MITGVDLIQEQIRVAQGEKLRYTQQDITFKVRVQGFQGGVAEERTSRSGLWCCVYAEGPSSTNLAAA